MKKIRTVFGVLLVCTGICVQGQGLIATSDATVFPPVEKPPQKRAPRIIDRKQEAAQEAARKSKPEDWKQAGREPEEEPGQLARETGLLFKTDRVSEGYTLLATMGCQTTYLIDNDGRVIHQWEHQRRNRMTAVLLPNGNLLHSVGREVSGSQGPGLRGPMGMMLEELSWEGDILWEYRLDGQKIHHDFERLPNGHTLIIVQEEKSRTECAAVGRVDEIAQDDQPLLVDTIYEVKPTGRRGGEIVWKWSPWDHLVQDRNPALPNYGKLSDHPGRININAVRSEGKVTSDWLHMNSVAYNAERDEIMVCPHALGEVWVISRKTGQLVYRYGNPEVYGRGGPEDRVLYNHHDAHWIPDGLPGAGNILIFNNGVYRPGGDYSSVLEVKPLLRADGTWEFDQGEEVWEYTATPKESMFASSISGAGRLAKGNTLICVGTEGLLMEVDPSHVPVWKFINPVVRKVRALQKRRPGSRNSLFRAYKYPPDYPAFAGRELESADVLLAHSND